MVCFSLQGWVVAFSLNRGSFKTEYAKTGQEYQVLGLENTDVKRNKRHLGCGFVGSQINYYHGNPQPSFLGVVTHIFGV